MKITLAKIPGRKSPQVRVTSPGGVDFEEAAAVAEILRDWISDLPEVQPAITVEGGEVTYHTAYHHSEKILEEFGRWLDVCRIEHNLMSEDTKPPVAKAESKSQLEITFPVEELSDQQVECLHA